MSGYGDDNDGKGWNTEWDEVSRQGVLNAKFETREHKKKWARIKAAADAEAKRLKSWKQIFFMKSRPQNVRVSPASERPEEPPVTEGRYRSRRRQRRTRRASRPLRGR